MALSDKEPFGCIVGSRAHGLNKSGSDDDLLMLTDSAYKQTVESGWNTIYRTVQMLLDGVEGKQQYIHTWQILYPEHFLKECEVAQWMQENRDALVFENRANVFATAKEYFEKTEERLNAFYKVAPKRAMYALLHGKLLNDWANGKTFAECIRPDGAWKQVLLGVRDKKMEREELGEWFREVRSGVETSATFYEEEKEKPMLADLARLVEGKKFMTYAELRDAGAISDATEA